MFSLDNNFVLSATSNSSSVLEQAQKSLEAKRNQLPPVGPPGSDTLQDSKIIKSPGSTSMSTYENKDYGIRGKLDYGSHRKLTLTHML